MRGDVFLLARAPLGSTRATLERLIEHTELGERCLVVVDTGCDDATRAYLEEMERAHPAVVRVPPGDESGARDDSARDDDWVAVVCAGVSVPPGWLPRLRDRARAQPSCASVLPVGNLPALGAVELPPGVSAAALDRLLAVRPVTPCPAVRAEPVLCGLVLRRALSSILEQERWPGPVSVDGRVYVHAERRLDPHPSPGAGRREAVLPVAVRSEWAPEWVPRQTYRRMRTAWRRGDPVAAASAALAGVPEVFRSRRERVAPGELERLDRRGALRVTYVLDRFCLAGGVLSVIQLVNELSRLGVEARIAALRPYPELDGVDLASAPLFFRTPRDLVRNLPESDVLVATYWRTAPWVAQAVRQGRARRACYFVQDYEPWFYERSVSMADRVRATYPLIDSRIVKSEWLGEMLRRDGFDSAKIPLGVDLGCFYPRSTPSGERPRPRVLAMARPSTPRRGFESTVAGLRQVVEAMPEVEVVLFGELPPGGAVPFPHEARGAVSDRDEMARLYASADVFLDGSDFQGFGRSALEAMACGTACVLTDVGGVQEYAVAGDNCLRVRPGRPDQFAAAVLHLLRDSGLREKLAEGGRARAQDFCHREEARRTLELLSARAAGPLQGKEADLGRPTRSEPQASEGGPPQD